MEITAAHNAPIAEVAKAIREATLSPVDLVGACLDRIWERDGKLHLLTPNGWDRE